MDKRFLRWTQIMRAGSIELAASSLTITVVASQAIGALTLTPKRRPRVGNLRGIRGALERADAKGRSDAPCQALPVGKNCFVVRFGPSSRIAGTADRVTAAH